MADQRITQLAKLAQVDVAANDVLPIVDVGASTTKKVEVKELFQAGANLADSASIDLIKLNQASTTKLGTTALADDAVTAAKLANDSAIAYDSVAPTIDNFDGRGYVNSTSKNLQVWNGTSFDQVVAPTAGIADLAVTTGKLAANAVTTAKVDAAGLAAAALATDSVITAKIQDLAVTTGKLAALSITTAKIADGAVTADKLASNAVVTASIVDANVTEAKLATGSVTEGKIGTAAVTVTKVADTSITYAKLNLADGSVPGAKIASASVTSNQMAANSITTNALVDLNVTTGKIADSAITVAKVANGSITTAKIDAAGLAAAAIASNAITTAKVVDDAITAAKLADDSATIVQAGTPTGSGDFEGQQWFDTNTGVQYVWDSTAWIRQAAINVINFTDSTPVAFSVAYPNTHTATVTTTLDTQVANRAFLGPAAGADAAPTFRAIVPADLPDATASAKGIIQPGTGLVVNGGILNHSNSVTAGTYTKLTVDSQGHTSAGASLEAADIPNIDAAKITSGELPTARLADNAVTIDKLSDYSTASLGETFPTPSFIGQIHLNPLDKSFFMWDGNVFVPIGISAGQIIFAGTFDASSPSGVGKVASVTPEGAAAGFVVNSAVPASAPGNNKHYLVVSEGGTITSGNAPNVALAPPDLILSVYNSTSPGWVEIDVSSGAGAIAASQVSFVSTSDVGSSNVQSAIEEVSTECRNATNITSGTLAVARGGTNLASYTKGDIIVASGSTTLAKRTVGTNGQVLTADSAEATGLKWATPTVGTVTDVTSATTALTVATSTTTPALTIRAATTSVDGIVQLSDSTGTTSSVLAATPTAVKSAYDLAAAALPKAGGTVTGDITLGTNIGIQFEGTTDDANEIRLIGADATADRTITLPNVTGTVVTTGDSGTVTSTMIADDTILNADINASAAIALSKLATGALPTEITIASANIVDGTILNADVNASAAIAGTKVSPDFGSQTVATTGIFSSAAGTAAAPSIAFTGDLNTGIYSPGADQLAVSTGGTGRLFVASDGKVGVGTGSPVQQLSIQRSAVAGNGVVLNLNNPYGYGSGVGLAATVLRFNRSSSDAGSTGVMADILAGNESESSSAAGYLAFGTRTGASEATTERLRIDSSGNVIQNYVSFDPGNAAGFITGTAYKIGSTNAPGISIAGRNGTNSNAGFITFDGQSTNGNPKTLCSIGSIQTNTSTNRANGSLLFYTNGDTSTDGSATPTERLRIDSSGRLLVGASGWSDRATSVLQGNSTDGATGPGYLVLSRGLAPGSLGAGNSIGVVAFTANNAGSFGQIVCEADGAVGTGDYPGRLTFSTTADGASSPTERLRIDSSGRVGIGTSSPTAKTEIASSGSESTLILRNTSSASSTYSELKFAPFTGTTAASASIRTTYTQDNNSTLEFRTTSAAAEPVERMRIDSSGRVGIGTSTPGYNLVVQSDSTNTSFNAPYFNYAAILRNDNLTNNNFVGFSFNTKTTGGQDVTIASMAAQCTNHATGAVDGNLAFYTTATSVLTERMRIANTGAVYTFSSTTDAFVSRSSSAAGTSNYNIRCTYSATGTLDGTIAFQVSTNGNVTNTNNSYGAISDIKLKENIVDATSQWSDIKALQVRRYNFKEGQTHTQIGLVAQEVELVSPGLVNESPDRDEDGNDLGTVTKSVNYSVLYMKAVKALQEAMERIETLEAAVAALQGA